MKDKNNKTVFITGIAGFIGFYLGKKLLGDEGGGFTVIGLDNMNNYYDVSLKETRLSLLYQLSKESTSNTFEFVKGSLADGELISSIFEKYKPDIVVNLAAQAGVRYSITNPDAYVEANLIGFVNILEACRHSYDQGEKGVEHLIYASSSSVYGSNKKTPYSTEGRTDNPVSLYAATKKSNELLAHAYAKLYRIPATGLRFFTVYGPMGRPDMAYYSFADKMSAGRKIQVYNYGDMYRDFTYIDDIITGIFSVMQRIPDADEYGVRYKLYNIGNNKPENLMHFIEVLEKCLMEEGIIDRPAEKELLPMQPGDVYMTYADINELVKDFGFKPGTDIETGLRRFAEWYKEYHFSEVLRNEV